MHHRIAITLFCLALAAPVGCVSDTSAGGDVGGSGDEADTGGGRGSGGGGGGGRGDVGGLTDVGGTADGGGADTIGADAGSDAGTACETDDDCPEGELCGGDGVCGPGCTSDAECEGGTLCEDGVCREVACATDEDCDDGNPCTADTCDGGMCRRSNIVAPELEDDTPGDCLGLTCVDGLPTPVADDADVPADDGIDCTVEGCMDGVMLFTPSDPLCDDGDPANGDEYCVPEDGGCVNRPADWICEDVPTDDGWLDEEICDNGQDDDGDGQADEDCPCDFGTTQPCYLGPPVTRDVGGCLDGVQQCTNSGAPRWGECEGGFTPEPERCDGKDNDCNGCDDDMPDCEDGLVCPVEDFARPLTWYDLDGEAILGTEGTGWEWSVRAPRNSATTSVERPNSASTRVYFDVSGDYEISLTVIDEKGARVGCTFVVHVQGTGLRVEMRWDTFGRVDMDLHLHRAGSRRDWCTEDDCYFANCRTYHTTLPWGYARSPADVCPEGEACDNPRLDIDNISGFDPENINIDNPNDRDVFRVMAHMYSGSSTTNPVISIYCGGALSAVLGEAPDAAALNRSGGSCGGQTWRVADVAMAIDEDTGVTTCRVFPLIRDGEWDIRLNDASF